MQAARVKMPGVAGRTAVPANFTPGLHHHLIPEAWLGVRHLQALMLFLAMVFAFGMRVNMSMAIVAMTDPDDENSFEWSSQRQGVILSSFFWGYVILQIPGGELAARVGSKLLFTICVGVNSAISLLIPISAGFGGWQWVCACRVLQGLTQGFLYPSMHNIIGKWIPLEEKSSLGTFIYAGQRGRSSSELGDGRSGAAAQLMLVGHRIYGELASEFHLRDVGFHTIMIAVQNGVMSALPYLAMYLMGFPLGFAADYVLKKKWLSITACRKISNSIGQWGPALALIGLSYAPADTTIAVAILTIVVGLNAGHYTGYMLVHIDMSPNFAGPLMGITNCIANVVSMIAPLTAGLILTDQTDQSQWRTVFYVSSAIYGVGNLIFVIFGTSKVQDWNEPNSNQSKGYITQKKSETV
ncbi:unnamed protein product [Chilo suppressalis]|uniref:Major facilitator superfamily (MFS) profile domain-containing protein n=1 Tax=Chilo suppressalis TaxID=168631 RepID=A0ABN8AUU3_CHISP|nr:hypothetical protein evm_011372 [Chilo suppressalis]CAH0398529.1 unnamed protein product [Chilo suppressalis]